MVFAVFAAIFFIQSQMLSNKLSAYNIAIKNKQNDVINLTKTLYILKKKIDTLNTNK